MYILINIQGVRTLNGLFWTARNGIKAQYLSVYWWFSYSQGLDILISRVTFNQNISLGDPWDFFKKLEKFSKKIENFFSNIFLRNPLFWSIYEFVYSQWTFYPRIIVKKMKCLIKRNILEIQKKLPIFFCLFVIPSILK